jgi:hypothetical protein
MTERITWIDPYLDILLDKIPIDSKSILEVGCGSGIFGFILKKTRSARVEGIEPFKGYELNHYDHIYRCEWKDFDKIGKNFDVAVSNETIEHMEKEDALSFLQQVKTVANKVIITTPYKFDQQPAFDDNPYQIHKSVISQKDYEKEGYKVKIIGKMLVKGISTRTYYDPKLSIIAKIMGNTSTNIMGIWEKNL